ncbi:MAG: DUF3575 domain-containing protein [Chitinophagales bacterium]|jgi:hypothetical protein|nr:DUF3575 domain-containing protein [Sphingobacteriales bacterium]MBP7533887.1 DUF3575 domain-containing protein [Chitinophagales bacterium]
MKKAFCSFLFIFALLFATQQQLAAQEVRNAIKINPLSIFLLTGNMQYERAIGERTSVQAGFFYSAFNLKWKGDGLEYTGLGFTPEFRYYVLPKQTAMNGLYVAPFARFQRFKIVVDDSSSGLPPGENSGTVLNSKLGVNAGYQAVLGKSFVIDIFAGPTVGVTRFTGTLLDYKLPGFGSGGFGFRFGLCLGVGF